MRVWRAVTVSIFSLMLMACACSKKRVDSDSDTREPTIPSAEADGPLKDINFAFDSSALTPVAQSTLRDNAKYLLDNPSTTTTIEGHCDERGTAEYNMALGERRANSAKKFMVGLGVDSSRMSTISYGKEMPLDNGHNEAAWARNRRDHFRIGK